MMHSMQAIVVILLGVLFLTECVGDDEGASVPAGDAKEDALKIYNRVIAVTADCDASSAKLATALKGEDIVFAYRTADQVEGNCLGVRSALAEIEIPDSITGEHRKTVEESLRACQTTYLMKWSGAQTLKKVIDEGARPSALAELQETTESVERNQMLCAGGLAAVATSLGATEKELGIKGSGAK